MDFLRVADDARDRHKAAKAPAGASSKSHGSANHVEERIGAISGLLNDIATGQAYAANGYASASSDDSRASSREGSRRLPSPSPSRSPSPS